MCIIDTKLYTRLTWALLSIFLYFFCSLHFCPSKVFHWLTQNVIGHFMTLASCSTHIHLAGNDPDPDFPFLEFIKMPHWACAALVLNHGNTFSMAATQESFSAKKPLFIAWASPYTQINIQFSSHHLLLISINHTYIHSQHFCWIQSYPNCFHCERFLLISRSPWDCLSQVTYF